MVAGEDPAGDGGEQRGDLVAREAIALFAGLDKDGEPVVERLARLRPVAPA